MLRGGGMGRMWNEYFDGANCGGVRCRAGWARTLALLFAVGGLRRWPLEAVAGVVN